jgi:class 3 adenylate cyclase
MMNALKAGRQWKRIIPVPLDLSILDDEDECDFGALSFRIPIRKWIIGGLHNFSDTGKVNQDSTESNAMSMFDPTPVDEALDRARSATGRSSSRNAYPKNAENEDVGVVSSPPQRTMILIKNAMESHHTGESITPTIVDAHERSPPRIDLLFSAINEDLEMHFDEDDLTVQPAASGCGAHEICFHEITANTYIDPVINHRAIVIEQCDVTRRVIMEDLIMGMSESQLSLLSDIFPRHVIEFLSLHDGVCPPEFIGSLARKHQDVTILFMDVVGFTAMSKTVEPQAVMTLLNQLFTIFDALCDVYGVQKVETAGDCYIAAAGILNAEENGFSSIVGCVEDSVTGARRIMSLAKAMIAGSKTVLMPHNGEPVSIRIGIHTGPCVTGLIGTKLPKFSIFGDTMNTASRMESTSRPGLIQISEDTWMLLRRFERFRSTGGVEIKGKGVMPTFIWEQSMNGGSSSAQPIYIGVHGINKSPSEQSLIKAQYTTTTMKRKLPSRGASYSVIKTKSTWRSIDERSSTAIISTALEAAVAAGGP